MTLLKFKERNNCQRQNLPCWGAPIRQKKNFPLGNCADMNAEQARRVVCFELDTDFTNALAHIREARLMFPSDTLFCQQDVQVIAELKIHPKEKKRGLLANFVSACQSPPPPSSSFSAHCAHVYSRST